MTTSGEMDAGQRAAGRGAGRRGGARQATGAGRHRVEQLAGRQQGAVWDEGQDVAEGEEPQDGFSGNSAGRGQERPQDAPRVNRGGRVVWRWRWVGLAQQTVTVGTLGCVPVFGGFMSAGRYSHRCTVDVNWGKRGRLCLNGLCQSRCVRRMSCGGDLIPKLSQRFESLRMSYGGPTGCGSSQRPAG
jgi:hypothetical protein